MAVLRQFLYDNVYRSPQVHNEYMKAKKILIDLYHYFLENMKMTRMELDSMGMCHESKSHERLVCDLIASMTDRYALELYRQIFFPMPFV